MYECKLKRLNYFKDTIIIKIFQNIIISIFNIEILLVYEKEIKFLCSPIFFIPQALQQNKYYCTSSKIHDGLSLNK